MLTAAMQGKEVEDNQTGAAQGYARKVYKRHFRQYMNRRGTSCVTRLAGASVPNTTPLSQVASTVRWRPFRSFA